MFATVIGKTLLASGRRGSAHNMVSGGAEAKRIVRLESCCRMALACDHLWTSLFAMLMPREPDWLITIRLQLAGLLRQ